MFRFLLVIFIIQLSQVVFSQKALLSLTDRNTIYTGIPNAVDFAVEGLRRNEIKITTKGCSIDSQYKYLTASSPGKCNVILSYLKEGLADSQTIVLNIKMFPRIEPLFGKLESGSYSIEMLAAVDSLEVLTLFDKELNEMLNFKITKFACAFVPKSGNACFYYAVDNKIPQELKKNIFSSNNGDKILIDDILCYSKKGRGISKRLIPIVITINSNSKIETPKNNYCQYKAQNDSDFSYYSQPILNCNNNFNFRSGIMRVYKTTNCDTFLVEEIKKIDDKLVWKKVFYQNGSLSLYAIFENNDSIGQLTSYYDNGNLKANGNVISYLPNIYQSYRGEIDFGHCVNYDNVILADSLLICGFAPYGKWKGYYKNGQLALDCELKLFEVGKTFDDYHSKLNMLGNKQSTLKEAFENSNNFYIARLSGRFVTFNPNGEKKYEFKY